MTNCVEQINNIFKKEFVYIVNTDHKHCMSVSECSGNIFSMTNFVEEINKILTKGIFEVNTAQILCVCVRQSESNVIGVVNNFLYGSPCLGNFIWKAKLNFLLSTINQAA